MLAARDELKIVELLEKAIDLYENKYKKLTAINIAAI
jgi:hypothetical protein